MKTSTIPAAATSPTSTPYRAAQQSSTATRSPNQVIVWNRILLGILRTRDAHPIHPTRCLAMMHLAMADAVAAITGRFAPYAFDAPASPHASPAAAAARAAHEVLLTLYPQLSVSLDINLANSLRTIRNGSGKTAGIAVGVRAGRLMPRVRAYRSTAVTPFLLDRADQFRPPPPPSVSSESYRNALAEVRSLGKVQSLTRAPDQTDIARFWAAPIENYWNEIAQTASLVHHDSVSDDARLFALLNASLADAVLACHDAKYAYRSWRPEAAVIGGGILAHDVWAPLVRTPADRSYPSEPSAVSFAGATILMEEFGDRVEFDLPSSGWPPVARSFATFTGAAQEAGRAGIYAGTHFRFDHEAGERVGRLVANFASSHALALAWAGGSRG